MRRHGMLAGIWLKIIQPKHMLWVLIKIRLNEHPKRILIMDKKIFTFYSRFYVVGFCCNSIKWILLTFWGRVGCRRRRPSFFNLDLNRL